MEIVGIYGDKDSRSKSRVGILGEMAGVGVKDLTEIWEGASWRKAEK